MADDIRISSLKEQEVQKMISRAIASGKAHGIKLKQGRINPGNGDCAIEATLYNNNDRQCFATKYTLPISLYRKNWTADMAKRTVDSPWNTVGTNAWYKGWKDMAIPGTYERGIFGDLMLQAIACGVRKTLLIFNTYLLFMW